MSKKNIVKKEVVGNKLHLTFETPTTFEKYEYVGNTRKAIERGIDPVQLSGGRHIETVKKKS